MRFPSLSHLCRYIASAAILIISQFAFAQQSDTLIFDLANAEFIYENGIQSIGIPVRYTGPNNEINAIDFWFQFNQTKLSYDQTISEQPQLDSFTNFNSENEFLSNSSSTSQSEEYVDESAILQIIKFNLLDPCAEISLNDFSNAQCLINGNLAFAHFTQPVQSAQIILISDYPLCGNSPIEFTFPNQINGQSISAYNWDFGVSTSNTQTAEAIFPFAGSYSPQLNTTTEAGCSFFFATDISVTPSPDVSFTWTGNPTVSFTNTSTIGDGTIVSYLWNFDDNETSTDTNPMHNFTQSGSYQVSLSATSALGCTGTATQNVSVTVGVEQLADRSAQISLYPNPCTTELRIFSDTPGEIFVYNITGQCLQKVVLRGGSSGNVISTENLVAGQYFIQFVGSGVIQTVPLIVL
jgi:PKD repeat protein